MHKTNAYGAATIQGSWPVLEDAFYADPGKSFYVIADGAGGRDKGDLAARTAILAVKEIVQGGFAALVPDNGASNSQEKRLSFLAEQTQLQLWEKNKNLHPSERAALSFLASSLSSNGQLSLWGCGACGAALWRNSEFYPLLLPDLWCIADGSPPLPRQALGLGNKFDPIVKSLSVNYGDIVLLHSSGFSLQSPGVRDFLQTAFLSRAPGDNLQELAAGVLSHFASETAFFNQSLILIEL